MTKRDFFILIIKLFGLAAVITTLFSVMPGYCITAFRDADTLVLLWLVGTVVILVCLFYLLIFKADVFVRILKLDKGFDDDRIELGNLSAADVIKIGTFIIGGLLILNNIFPFLSHSFYGFKHSIAGINQGLFNKFLWIESGFNMLLGFLLATNYAFVARLLNTPTGRKKGD